MARSAKVLLIDDCEEAGFLVKMSLKPYEVRQAFSVKEAGELVRNEPFDLFLIDGQLPDGDGFKICHELASEEKFRDVPKIILTARRSPNDKVLGLNCGADDYVTKPFYSPELKARVDVCLRRTRESTPRIFTFSRFEFDNQFHRCRMTAEYEKVDLLLTPTEFRIFLILAKNAGSSLTREELVEKIWKANCTHIEPRGIDTHVAHLRKKLGPFGNMIVSVYGKGYAIENGEV